MEAELNAALAADAAAAPDDSSQATATGLAAENNALLRLSLPANGLDADGDLPVLELRIDQARSLMTHGVASGGHCCNSFYIAVTRNATLTAAGAASGTLLFTCKDCCWCCAHSGCLLKQLLLVWYCK